MNSDSKSPIPPGSTIGILGGGQLGRMMAMAAAEMGYHVHIYCPDKDIPASEVAAHTTNKSYDDLDALRKFAQSVDVITYEFENIPAGSLDVLAGEFTIRPSAKILRTSQHRAAEKTTINMLGIATAPFVPVNSLAQLQAAVKKLGLPAVLKTCTMGYDGKGQVMIKKASELAGAWKKIGSNDAILEGFVDFTMELSVIVARGVDGSIACYCPVQNIHKHHILHETIAPAPITPALTKKAETIARTIAKGLDLVGLLAIEMFVIPSPYPLPQSPHPTLSRERERGRVRAGEGKGEGIIVNEIAPRPHNSGHWTMDACITGQFEQAIRAVCGLKLGPTTCLSDARMLNLIGDDVKNWKRYAAMPNAKLHLYGKKEIRPGRKMGHVTFLRHCGE